MGNLACPATRRQFRRTRHAGHVPSPAAGLPMAPASVACRHGQRDSIRPAVLPVMPAIAREAGPARHHCFRVAAGHDVGLNGISHEQQGQTAPEMRKTPLVGGLTVS